MIVFISFLPEEIKNHEIKPYMSLSDLHLTNKRDYKKHKYEIFSSLYEKKRQTFTTSFISKLIRNDYAFIFETLLNVMFKHWYKAWKIRYKDNVFSCYIDLLNYQCIEYKSNSCRNLIDNKNGLN